MAKRNKLISIRVEENTHRGLEHARKRARPKRSLSREAEMRLTRTLEEDRIAERTGFDDVATRDFFRLVAAYGQEISRFSGASWRDDQFSFETFKEGILIALQECSPNGRIKLPKLADLPDTPTSLRETLRDPKAFARSLMSGLLIVCRTMGGYDGLRLPGGTQ